MSDASKDLARAALAELNPPTAIVVARDLTPLESLLHTIAEEGHAPAPSDEARDGLGPIIEIAEIRFRHAMTPAITAAIAYLRSMSR